MLFRPWVDTNLLFFKHFFVHMELRLSLIFIIDCLSSSLYALLFFSLGIFLTVFQEFVLKMFYWVNSKHFYNTDLICWTSTLPRSLLFARCMFLKVTILLDYQHLPRLDTEQFRNFIAFILDDQTLIIFFSITFTDAIHTVYVFLILCSVNIPCCCSFSVYL